MLESLFNLGTVCSYGFVFFDYFSWTTNKALFGHVLIWSFFQFLCFHVIWMQGSAMGRGAGESTIDSFFEAFHQTGFNSYKGKRFSKDYCNGTGDL